MTNIQIKRSGRHAFSALLLACFAAALPATSALGATQEDKTEFSVKAGTLAFSTVPAMPTLPEVTLTGGAQTTNTTMTNFGIKDATRSGSGRDTDGARPSAPGKKLR